MGLTLSLDPGVTRPAAGLFSPEKTLVAARYWKGSGFKGELNRISTLAVDIVRWASGFGEPIAAFVAEWQVLRGRKDVKAIQSQAPLWALVGAVGALLWDRPQFLYTPADWKGGLPPNPTARLVINALSIDERKNFDQFDEFSLALTRAELESIRQNKRVDVKHPAEDTSDAVGIGLKHLGRFGRRRVIERTPPVYRSSAP